MKTEDFSKLSKLLLNSYISSYGVYILRRNDYFSPKMRLVSVAAVQLWVLVLEAAFNFLLIISNQKYKRVRVVNALQNWIAHLQRIRGNVHYLDIKGQSLP